MFCPKCGTENQDTAKYCRNCGNPLPNAQSQQLVPPVKTQLPGVACHYPGCTEPVIGQCPGYKGSCLRYYCAKHSVEPYCSVCAEKILRDAAIRAMYEDYLSAARKVPGEMGCFSLVIIMLASALIGAAVFGGDGGAVLGTFVGVIVVAILYFRRQNNREKQIAEISKEKPGFAEFYAAYMREKASANMANVLTGLLVAGAAVNAIQNYQMRQDIHEIVKRIKS